MTHGVIAGLHGQLDAFLRSGLQESDITLRKEMETMDLSKFFAKGALIPVICQDERNGEVLMLGYANEEALQKTMETGTAWFFSRSRQKLWNKGETSGNFIFVQQNPVRLRRRHAHLLAARPRGRSATPATAPASTRRCGRKPEHKHGNESGCTAWDWGQRQQRQYLAIEFV